MIRFSFDPRITLSYTGRQVRIDAPGLPAISINGVAYIGGKSMILRDKRASIGLDARAKVMPRDAAPSANRRNNKQMGLTRRAVCNMQVVAACMFAFSAPANATDLYFCWVGGGGYTMTGQMTLVDGAMAKTLVTEADVTGFSITGFLNGDKVGGWDLKDRMPETTWHLRFSPNTMEFPVGGSFGSLFSQGWNAHGRVSDCGNPGFGFNSGNAAQDVCVNGVYELSSRVNRATPFPVFTSPPSLDCKGIIPLS